MIFETGKTVYDLFYGEGKILGVTKYTIIVAFKDGVIVKFKKTGVPDHVNSTRAIPSLYESIDQVNKIIEFANKVINEENVEEIKLPDVCKITFTNKGTAYVEIFTYSKISTRYLNSTKYYFADASKIREEKRLIQPILPTEEGLPLKRIENGLLINNVKLSFDTSGVLHIGEAPLAVKPKKSKVQGLEKKPTGKQIKIDLN